MSLQVLELGNGRIVLRRERRGKVQSLGLEGDEAATLRAHFNKETVACPYCEGTGRRLGSDRPCDDPNGCKGSGRLPPLPQSIEDGA